MPGTILRHCTYQGCSTLVRAGRCASHPYARARHSSTHGQAHRVASAHVIANATTCARCGKPFSTTDPPTRGHRIAAANGGACDPANYRAEHESCNKRAGAIAANATR